MHRDQISRVDKREFRDRTACFVLGARADEVETADDRMHFFDAGHGLGATDRIAMSRVALSPVLNGKAAISPDLALRLEQAGTSTARAWLAMQVNYDLWCARQHAQPPVRPLQDAA